MADCEVDPWVFSRKGKQGGSDVFIEGRWGVAPPHASEIARKFVKSRPCCKRNGHGATVISMTSLLLATVYCYH